MEGVDPAAQRQTCKACGRPDKFDFHVPDEVWRRVVPERFRNRVLCLCCFDDFAREAGIDYAVPVLYFAGDQTTIVFNAEMTTRRADYF